jgi:hypothetical protein
MEDRRSSTESIHVSGESDSCSTRGGATALKLQKSEIVEHNVLTTNDEEKDTATLDRELIEVNTLFP